MSETLAVLAEPLYPVSEAARLSHIPVSTLKRWILGHRRRDSRGAPVFDPPVLRADAAGREDLSWGDFIEALYLRAYRALQIPLPRMRKVIAELRDERGTPYPLATEELIVHGHDVFRRLAGDLVRVPGGQGVMEETVLQSLRELHLEFADGYAVSWRPSRSIRIDPLIAFGRPTIDRGVPTRPIFESFTAGDSVSVLADAYEVPTDEVEAAIRFEQELRRAA